MGPIAGHPRRRAVRLLLAVVAAAITSASGASSASAAPPPAEDADAMTLTADGVARPPALAATDGWVRFGHFAPSATEVDVYLDGAPFVTGVAFKTASDYVPVAAGVHRFELKPAGQPAAAALLSLETTVPAGGAVTIGALTTADGIASQVYDDAPTVPPAGRSLVRFIHAAPDVPGVDLVVAGGGPVLTSALGYPTATDYTSITPGAYDIEVRAAGSDQVLLRIAAWSIQPGTQASVVIVRGSDGALDVAPLVDAAAMVVVPVGGVQTGYGGMAGADADSTPVGAALASTLAVMALTWVVWRAVPLRRRAGRVRR